jgi:hypothetical protein
MSKSIPLISIATINACQNRCRSCAHQGIRDSDPEYSARMYEIEALLRRLEQLDAYVQNVSLCGPGEPLLHPQFNGMAKLIWASGRAKRLETTTNGKLLSRIDCWDALTEVFISDYGQPLDLNVLAQHANKVTRMGRGTFWCVDENALPANGQGACGCPGALYYKGLVYPHCGPVVFDAFRRTGKSHHRFGVPIQEWDPDALPKLPDLPCRWCWGNPNTQKTTHPHSQRS